MSEIKTAEEYALDLYPENKVNMSVDILHSHCRIAFESGYNYANEFKKHSNMSYILFEFYLYLRENGRLYADKTQENLMKNDIISFLENNQFKHSVGDMFMKSCRCENSTGSTKVCNICWHPIDNESKLSTPKESDAVEFAEWIGKKTNKDAWFKYNNKIKSWYIHVEGYLTTQKLYELFLKTKGK